MYKYYPYWILCFRKWVHILFVVMLALYRKFHFLFGIRYAVKNDDSPNVVYIGVVYRLNERYFNLIKMLQCHTDYFLLTEFGRFRTFDCQDIYVFS